MRAGSSLPPEARRAFALIWNDLIADIYDELKGSSRTAIMRPATISRVLNRVAGQIDEANRLLIVTATHSPAPGSTEWHFIGAAAAGSGLGAGVNEVITFGSAGAGAAAALGSAVLTELLETYLAASGRVMKYQQEGRNPDPQLIAEDLAEALGQDGRFRAHANRETGEAALRWINKQMGKRLSRRFLRGLIPLVGMAVAAQASGRDVKKVLDVPIRPATPAELHRAQQLDDPFAAAQLDYAQFIETHAEKRAAQTARKRRWRR